MDQAKVANQVWEEIKRNWREILTRESDKIFNTCGVCGNDKREAKRNKAGQTVCEATEENCKENQKIQESNMIPTCDCPICDDAQCYCECAECDEVGCTCMCHFLDNVPKDK